jgi:hypothetical protein
MKPAKTQEDRNLDFDGMKGDGVNRGANKYAGNHWAGVQNPNKTFNEGVGPRKGNQDHPAMRVGPPATKDAYRATPTTRAVPDTHVKNIDSVNRGAQVRTPGGTRAWDPKMGQNYTGNIDKINIQPKGTNGMGESESTNPIAISKKPGNPDGINYGPKRQY